MFDPQDSSTFYTATDLVQRRNTRRMRIVIVLLLAGLLAFLIAAFIPVINTYYR